MIVPKKLKLNRYRHVVLPKGRDYFYRYGFSQAPASSLSGDDEPVGPESKLEMMSRLQREYDRRLQEEEDNK